MTSDLSINTQGSRVLTLLRSKGREWSTHAEIAVAAELKSDWTADDVHRVIYRVRQQLAKLETGDEIETKPDYAAYRLSVKVPEPGKRIPVILPIGGDSLRMSPITRGMPKALLPVGDRSMLEWILSSFKDDEFGPIYVVYTSHLKLIKRHISLLESSQLRNKIELTYFLGRPPQVISALLDNAAIVDRFVIHFGDNVIDRQFDWHAAIEQLAALIEGSDQPVGGLLLGSADHQYNVGLMAIGGEDGRTVMSFTEKPTSIIEQGFQANVPVAILTDAFAKTIAPEDRDLYGESVPRAIMNGLTFKSLGNVRRLRLQDIPDWIEVQDAFEAEGAQHEPVAVTRLRGKLRRMGLL